MRIDSMFQPMTLGLAGLGLGFMDHSHSRADTSLHSQQSQSLSAAMDDFLMDEDDDDDSRDGLGQADTGSGTNSSQRKAEIRKSNKPIMEKKRRARINNCLNDLKAILLEAMRKDPARHSKLEKADILELTVRHLQNVQRNQLAIAMASDPTVLHRFKNGFSECLAEVNRYLGKLDGIDQGMRHRLTGHLSTCITGLQQATPPPAAFGAPAPPPSMPVLPIPFPHPHLAAPNIMVMPTNLGAMGQGQRDIKNSGPTAHVQQNLQSQSQLAQDLNNNTNLNRNERQHFTPASASAFSIVTAERTPPPSTHGLQLSSSSSLLISPPTSSEGDDTSLSLSFGSTTGSGGSTSTGTNLNNTSTSISSGSDISVCTGSEKGTNTSPNSFAKSSAMRAGGFSGSGTGGESCPIDFSLKFKEAPVRVLKVEPIMMVMAEDDGQEEEEQEQERRDSRGAPLIRSRRTILGPKDKDSMWRPW